MLSAMVALGRKNTTGLITTSARQALDWSADYRLFAKQRVDTGTVFDVVRREVLQLLGKDDPFVVALDDTRLRKKGRKIPGAFWQRDPMGPPFHVNFIWAQRFLQISALTPTDATNPLGRTIPIRMEAAPVPRRPRSSASTAQIKRYQELKQRSRVSVRGAQAVELLRDQLDEANENQRHLVVTGDGGYTNRQMLRNLPERTTFIGRIRQDAALYELAKPTSDTRAGRRRRYGKKLTPEHIRRDPDVPWHEAPVYAAGKVHQLQYKRVGPVLWRAAGYDKPLTLIIIAPLKYRLSKNSRILFRKPAFLICTDPAMPPEHIVRWYIRRWDIEVNFRDAKQLFGIEDPQVRNPASANTAAPFLTAAYAILLLAATRLERNGPLVSPVPPERWRRRQNGPRATTSDLIRQLRHEMWAHASSITNFSHFKDSRLPTSNPEKYLPNLLSASIYARP